MSLVTKSAPAIRKCKGCGQPTKGHSGPTGITKCQNQEPGGDVKRIASIRNKNLGLVVVDSLEVPPSDSKKLEVEVNSNLPFDEPVECMDSLCLEAEADDVSELTKTEEKQECADDVSELTKTEEKQECADDVSELTKTEEKQECADDVSELTKTEEKQECADDVSELTKTEKKHECADDVSELTKTEEKQECALLDPYSEGDREDFLSQSTLEDLESLLKRDEKQLIRKRVAPERVESSSDSDVDIRKVVAGNSFLLCECAFVTSGIPGTFGELLGIRGCRCACKGLVRFNNDLQGELVNVFMDPSSEEENDFLPSVGSTKSSWKKENPNEMILSVDSVASNVNSSEGEMQMKAYRYVEIIKGKKAMSVEVESIIDVSITLDNYCMEEDISSPLIIIKKFKLLQVENCYDDLIGENSFEEKSSEESSQEHLPDVSDDSDGTHNEDDNAHTENEVFCESNEEEDNFASEDNVDEVHSETEYDLDEDETSDGNDEVEKVAMEESIEEGDCESIYTEDNITEEELDEEGRSDEDESEETSWIEESLDSDVDHDYESED